MDEIGFDPKNVRWGMARPSKSESLDTFSTTSAPCPDAGGALPYLRNIFVYLIDDLIAIRMSRIKWEWKRSIRWMVFARLRVRRLCFIILTMDMPCIRSCGGAAFDDFGGDASIQFVTRGNSAWGMAYKLYEEEILLLSGRRRSGFDCVTVQY